MTTAQTVHQKIVHICLCGATTDGFSYQENLLAKYHRKMGYEVTIIASQWITGTDGELTTTQQTGYRNADDVKMIRLPLLYGTIDTKLRIFPDIIKAIDAERPDILFIHGPQFLDVCRIAGYVKRRPGIRVYVDNHADYSNSASGWLSRTILHGVIWRFCTRRIAPYTQTFYGVMPARVDFLKERYGLSEDQCRLLVMGADDELAEAAESQQSICETRTRYGVQNNDFLIVTGGKIDAWKPQTLLLMQAVRHLGNPKVKLVVFGSVAKELREEFDALTGDSVQYIGWLSNEESYQIFAAADLAVFPGRHSVYWEQVAGQGIPMIVKDWPGTHHVDLGGNVRFLCEDSKEEIEKVLLEVTADPQEYDRMKAAAREKGPKVFRYSVIARESICADENRFFY